MRFVRGARGVCCSRRRVRFSVRFHGFLSGQRNRAKRLTSPSTWPKLPCVTNLKQQWPIRSTYRDPLSEGQGEQMRVNRRACHFSKKKTGGS